MKVVKIRPSHALVLALAAALSLPVHSFELASQASCFFIRDIHFQLNRNNAGEVVSVEWSAQVTNRCESDLQVPIAAGFFSQQDHHLVTDFAMAEIKAGEQQKVQGQLSEDTLRTFERVRDTEVDLNQIIAMEANVTDQFLQNTRRALAASDAVVDAVKDAVDDELEHRVEVLPEETLE